MSERVSVSDIVFLCLLMASKEMVRMISEPSKKRRLWFGEVVINRVKKEMMFTGKNMVVEIIKFDNGFNGLRRSFTFMKVVINSMMLIVLETARWIEWRQGHVEGQREDPVCQFTKGRNCPQSIDFVECTNGQSRILSESSSNPG